MAALVVQSRFAGLKIEDDDHPGNDNQKSKKIKANPGKKIDPPKKPKTANNKSQSAVVKKRKHKPVEATTEQWEMWKQKDEEIVVGNFENQLQEAILLSKLDFEEKKDVYKQLKKTADTERKKLEEQARPGNKKQKKKNVMSLEQFNDMVTGNEEPNIMNVTTTKTEEEQKIVEKDTKFFNRVEDDLKNELLKEKIIERVRNQSIPDEVLTRIQFTEALKRKDKEITDLKNEVTTLKAELLTVKSRNKKLCNILGQGEMKDKAEILVEVERLRAVQVELNTELASLHTDLEKERSKNADPRAKDKKKRANGDKDK